MRFRPIIAAACQEAERIDASSVRPSFGNGLRKRLYECAAPAPHPALNGVFFQSAFFFPRWANPGEAVMVPAPERAPSTTGACCQLSPGGRHEEVRFAERQISQCFNLSKRGGLPQGYMPRVGHQSGMFYPWQSGFGGLVARAVKWRPFPGGSPVLPPLLVCVRAENSAGFPQSLPCPWAGSR